MLIVNEIFPAIQGEGTLVGTPQVFIRLQGCSAKCTYCDSSYSWCGKGKEMDIADIVNEVEKYNCKSACITGGEPCEQEDSAALCHALQRRGYYVSVQTNGLQWCDLLEAAGKVCMDMKPPQINVEGKLIYSSPLLIRNLRSCDEVKVLISKESDFKYALMINRMAAECCVTTILQVLNNTGNDSRIALVRKYQWLVEEVKGYNFKEPYRVLPQLHVLIYGNQRRR